MIHKLKYLVAFNPLFSLTFNTISIVEVLEGFSLFDKLLRNSDGELNGKKILITRVSLLTFLFICTLFSTNIAVIFDLVGALFGPIVGLFVPVMTSSNLRLSYTKFIISKRRDLFPPC